MMVVRTVAGISEVEMESGEVVEGCGDVVNHPLHYTFGRYEVLDVIEDWGLPFHLGNVVKYVARAGRKSAATELEDLRKARFYLDRYIRAKGGE